MFSLNSEPSLNTFSVRNRSELFSVTLLDDNVQEFDTRWDEVVPSMSKIPSDDILERLYKLRTQLQEMQERMNSVNDSGEFQEVESSYSGRLSYVSSQPAMFPNSRSMLSRDKRWPLDTCNTPGLQENVLGNQFSTSDSPGDIIKEFTLANHKGNEDQSNRLQGWGHFS